MKNNFPWDHYSDQPYILRRTLKKNLRRGYTLDYFKLIATNLIYFPYLFFKFLIRLISTLGVETSTASKNFYGLCVNLDKGKEQYKLVEELKVKSLQIRVFLNDIENIDNYVEFAKKFGEDKELLITIIQDREHILNHKLLKKI